MNDDQQNGNGFPPVANESRTNLIYESDSDSPIESLPGTPTKTRASNFSPATSGQDANLNSEERNVDVPVKLQKELAKLVDQDQNKSSKDDVFSTPTDKPSPVSGVASSPSNEFNASVPRQQQLQETLESDTLNDDDEGIDEKPPDLRKLSNISYVDASDLASQVNKGVERYNEAAIHIAAHDSESELLSDNTPAILKKLYAHWKLVLGGIIALFVIATAVTVPTVLLLGKDEPVTLPEGDDTWIPCPFKNGVAEQEGCEKKGCTWRASILPWPSCYIPMDKIQYKVADGGNSVWQTKNQLLIHLQRLDSTVNLFGNPFTFVTLQIDCTHRHRVRVKVSADKLEPDPRTWTVKTDNNKKHDCESDEYVIDTPTAPGELFKLVLERKSTGMKIWNSLPGGLLVEDGFLQIANLLPTSYVYGMAENRHKPSLVRELDIRTWPQFSRSHDRGSTKPEDLLNLNSVHPFYLNLENSTANGVLFKTIYPSEYILLKAPGIVFRTIERILEFDIFVGQSPKHVSKLLHEVIGGFQLPPMWALGFHIAPKGFPEPIIDVFKKNNVVLDSVHLSPSLWTNNMVLDSNKISSKTFFKYIEANNDISWVLTVSPSVYASTEYTAYSEGLRSSAFIQWPGDLKQLPPGMDMPQNGDGKPYHVMFGKRTEELLVTFFDFQHDKAKLLWHDLLQSVRTAAFNYKGILVVDNEPLNFGTNADMASYSLKCPDDSSDSPPYPTAAAWGYGKGGRLSDGTLCMVGQHITSDGKSIAHLEMHNRYGMDMALKSHEICSNDERCFVLSHSTAYFPNQHTPSGTICKLLHADTSWEGMKRSLISVMEFNLLGMPLVAVDVCGNTVDMDEELCGRWMQLGTFFPVIRTEFSMTSNQGTTEGVLNSRLLHKWTKPSLQLRLSLLPYTYSALHLSQTEGEPLLKPLFYEFPDDENVRKIDTQFMYGSSIMVAPVLDQDSHEKGSLEVYFPDEAWYRIKADSGERLPHKQGNQTIPGVDHIPIFVRAGRVIPFQHSEDSPNVATALNNSIILGVFPKEGKASGFLYVDDGRIDSKKSENKFYFKYDQCVFNITRDKEFKDVFLRRLHLSRIIIYDWEMYDDRMLSNKKQQKAPPAQSTSSRQEFNCYPSHDHKILILEMDIDLTMDVDNNVWIIDWSMFKICSHLRSETGCYYIHYYNFQDAL